MPIKDLAHRFQDSYRIRLGDLDGRRPQALTDRIRITAVGPEVPQAFAGVYGSVDDKGVTEWEDDKSPDRFQVYLPITSLPIWIMPGQVLNQWWEVYRGKVCDRRCDGETEQLTRQACMCDPDVDVRIADPKQCSPMTRFSVMCPEVQAVLGSGSLVTHSRIAAETFPAAIWLAGPWLSKNVPVDAILRTHTHRGRTTFTFPTIQVLGPAEGFEAIGPGQAAVPQIGAGVPTPALEAGSERETRATGSQSPAPPQHEPFTGENEKYVGAEKARKFREACEQNGLNYVVLVEEATNKRTSDPKYVYVDEWPILRHLFTEAQQARPWAS